MRSCWATFIAILDHVGSLGYGLDIPEEHSILTTNTALILLHLFGQDKASPKDISYMSLLQLGLKSSYLNRRTLIFLPPCPLC